MNENQIVEWDESYSLGIPIIDRQHKKLIDMTNTLYKGCLAGDSAARKYFLLTIHDAVEYVRYHFTTEEKLLQRIGYPDFAAHKKQHEDFIRKIIGEVQSFNDGKPAAPHATIGLTEKTAARRKIPPIDLPPENMVISSNRILNSAGGQYRARSSVG